MNEDKENLNLPAKKAEQVTENANQESNSQDNYKLLSVNRMLKPGSRSLKEILEAKK